MASFYVDFGTKFVINAPAAVAANVTAIWCLVLIIWNPQKNATTMATLAYILLLISTALAVLDTGGEISPFVSSWIMLSSFATVFGVVGWLPIVLANSIFFAIRYLNGGLSIQLTAAIMAFCLIPIIISAIIWRGKSNNKADDKSYQHLASALNEVANKSEVVINAIGDGVIATDSQGVIQLINPAAQEIVGWGKQDAMTLSYKTVLKLLDNKDNAIDPANDPIQQVLNTNQQVRNSSLTIMTKSGKKIMAYIVVSPVGEPGSGVIIVFRDITKEKAEERQQAEFISTASHEMRTPVASIEGYLGLAINPQTATIDDRAKDYINKAHESAQHLGRLFQDLLDISKADDGRISNNPKVVNLVPFVGDIIQGLAQKATEKGLSLTYKPKPNNSNVKTITPEFTVNLDNDHIREIVSNLVENAIKYTKQGEIVIDVTGDNEHVVISVKDSGIGIPAEDMPHLFQKFYRVDDKDTRDIGGTGLGLYLSRRLSEIIGGRIWAESVYGQGSVFYLELPRISSQEASLITEQQNFKDAQNQINPQNNQTIAQPPIDQTASQTQQAPNIAPPTETDTPQLNNVPRGQALTPEQIAAYVAKQRELAQNKEEKGQ